MAVLVKDQNIMNSISFHNPSAGADRLAETLRQAFDVATHPGPTPVDSLATGHDELLSRVFHMNASIALLSSLSTGQAHARAKRECQGIVAGSQGEIDKVRLQDLSRRDFLCKYAFAGRPFLITCDTTASWGAIRRWTPQWLADTFPKAILERVDMGIEAWQHIRPISLDEYVARAMNSSDASPPPWSVPYGFFSLAGVANPATGQRFHNLMGQDFSTPALFRDNNWLTCMEKECQQEMAIVFLSPRGARQSNHQDHFSTSKWQTQCHGRKRWLLHPPELSRQLYYGKVDPFFPDFAQYPLYRGAIAERLDVTVEAGETLWWPPGWWHATHALTDGSALARNTVEEHNFPSCEKSMHSFCHGRRGQRARSTYGTGMQRNMHLYRDWFAEWQLDGQRHMDCEAHDIAPRYGATTLREMKSSETKMTSKPCEEYIAEATHGRPRQICRGLPLLSCRGQRRKRRA